jgi:hypothetical protein
VAHRFRDQYFKSPLTQLLPAMNLALISVSLSLGDQSLRTIERSCNLRPRRYADRLRPVKERNATNLRRVYGNKSHNAIKLHNNGGSDPSKGREN